MSDSQNPFGLCVKPLRTYRGPMEDYTVVLRADTPLSFHFPSEVVRPVSGIVDEAMKRFSVSSNFYALYGVRNSEGDLALTASPLGEDRDDMLMLGFVVGKESAFGEGIEAFRSALAHYAEFINRKLYGWRLTDRLGRTAAEEGGYATFREAFDAGISAGETLQADCASGPLN